MNSKWQKEVAQEPNPGAHLHDTLPSARNAGLKLKFHGTDTDTDVPRRQDLSDTLAFPREDVCYGYSRVNV